MAKRKSVESEKTAKPQDEFKVEFTKNFQGALNNRYFKVKEKDVITVTAVELEWLNSKGVIRG